MRNVFRKRFDYTSDFSKEKTATYGYGYGWFVSHCVGASWMCTGVGRSDEWTASFEERLQETGRRCGRRERVVRKGADERKVERKREESEGFARRWKSGEEDEEEEENKEGWG